MSWRRQGKRQCLEWWLDDSARTLTHFTSLFQCRTTVQYNLGSPFTRETSVTLCASDRHGNRQMFPASVALPSLWSMHFAAVWVASLPSGTMRLRTSLPEPCLRANLAALHAMATESLPHATFNRDDGAYLDIRVQDIWGDRHRRAIFDVRVFYLITLYYKNLQLGSAYRRLEKENRSYEDRVTGVENRSYTPLVFSTSAKDGNKGRLPVNMF